jgi:hypothetical protein
MLDTGNAEVLSYLRSTRSGEAVIVALNFTARAQVVTLNLDRPGPVGRKPAPDGPEVRTLLTDAPSLKSVTSTRSLTVPPFATWIAAVVRRAP